MDFKKKLTEYFLRYAAIESQSKAGAPCVPSTPGQTILAHILAKDLADLGLTDISISEHSVVIGHLPERLPEGHGAVPAIGWCAHMDTVDVNMSPDIHPVLIQNYQGGDLCQNPEKGIYISVQEHPELEKYIGDDILVSDGASVLGADNKAAIANIMTMLYALKEDESIPHGEIYIAFVPDEEVGLLGAKSMDLSLFPVDYAYTIDCCEKGELVYQTFNAGSAKVSITGVTAHPMSSKNNVVNPSLIAVDFINLLDRAETPEHTEKTEGFIWVLGIESNSLHATIRMAIRDHDKEKYAKKKQYLEAVTQMIRLKHPKAQVELEMEDVYGNINDAVTEENRTGIDNLFQAFEAVGIEPNVIAMRGGTDGSYLSTKGILTPNYFTGAHNFHAVCEFLPLSAFEASCKVTLKLVELAL